VCKQFSSQHSILMDVVNGSRKASISLPLYSFQGNLYSYTFNISTSLIEKNNVTTKNSQFFKKGNFNFGN